MSTTPPRGFRPPGRGRLRLPGLTGLEQAQRSWARAIRSLAEVPNGFAGFFDSPKVSEDPFPVVVLTPSYEGFLHKESERLLCALPEGLVILTVHGAGLDVVTYPYAGIDYVELRTILLDARLKIVGREDRGIHSSTIVRFNAVTDYLFSPILELLRSGGRPSKPTHDEQGANAFQGWGLSSLKFMNYARRSVLDGEQVEQAFLQPEIRVRLVSAFGRAHTRPIAPTLATILTDRELILIREVLVRRNQDRYGGIWDFIRLEAIETMETFTTSRDLTCLRLRFPGDERLEFSYDSAAREHLGALAEKAGRYRRREATAIRERLI